jgi:hypothetical protein
MKVTTVETLTKGFGLLALIALFIAAVILGPFCVIWAINILAPAAVIQYGFWQWLSVILLGVVLLGVFFRIASGKK